MRTHVAMVAKELPGFEFDLVEESSGLCAKRSRKPFCQLIHFRRDVGRDDPHLVVIAPLSGHNSALIRDTLGALQTNQDPVHSCGTPG